jgi:ADP-ribose pyrophosphatase YjhB (NUDIX family)/ketosteroid isomerase-like protein
VTDEANAQRFEIVRAWFAAFNRGDLEEALALYATGCANEQGGTEWTDVGGQRTWLTRAMPDGSRRTVRTMAFVEDGWMHAEWIARERTSETGEVMHTAGYDHFLIEDGRIQRQRGVAYPVAPRPEPPPKDDEAGPARPSRSYPQRPVVGVGAVIEHDGRIVLVRRRFEPLAGQWSLPGGTLEVGETLEAGVAREMLEETGLIVEVGPVIDVFDRILLDEERRVRYHYVIIDYLCRPLGGSLQHASDADAAVYADPAVLDEYRLTPKARTIIDRAMQMAREHVWDPIPEQP